MRLKSGDCSALPGNTFLRDEFVAVEDVIQSALDGAVPPVAAMAVGLEDRLRLVSQLGWLQSGR